MCVLVVKKAASPDVWDELLLGLRFVFDALHSTLQQFAITQHSVRCALSALVVWINPCWCNSVWAHVSGLELTWNHAADSDRFAASVKTGSLCLTPDPYSLAECVFVWQEGGVCGFMFKGKCVRLYLQRGQPCSTFGSFYHWHPAGLCALFPLCHPEGSVHSSVWVSAMIIVLILF